MKITAQDIKDLGFVPELYGKKADSEIIGTDGQNYVCIKDHIAATDNDPVTGANWQTYWVQSGSNGTAWVAAANYKASFKAFIDPVIAEQALQLSGRIGVTLYNSTTSPNADNIKLAEKCLTAAEMIRRRINIILANIQASGTEIGTIVEQKQRQDYLSEAEVWIAKLAQGVTSDPSAVFTSGALVTSHFE